MKKGNYINNDKFMFDCDLCGNSYQMGRHKYDGKQIPKYKLGVCKICYESNWDGWSPNDEPKILLHLEKNNIEIPSRNENGLLPRD